MTIYTDIIEVEILSLNARRIAAENYPYNKALHVEIRLLDAQIEALKTEFKLVTKGIDPWEVI